MINNVFCVYNEYLEALEIRTGEPYKISQTIEVNYGIKLQFDINMKLIAIIIPEPEVLFGTDIEYLKGFSSDLA